MNAVYIEKIKEKLEIKKLPAENAGSNSETNCYQRLFLRKSSRDAAAVSSSAPSTVTSIV